VAIAIDQFTGDVDDQEGFLAEQAARDLTVKTRTFRSVVGGADNEVDAGGWGEIEPGLESRAKELPRFGRLVNLCGR
jgi:hypothetical protein